MIMAIGSSKKSHIFHRNRFQDRLLPHFLLHTDAKVIHTESNSMFRYFFITKLFSSSSCRDFRPTSLEKNQEVIRLRFYCVYAWGIPLLICCIASILDNIPASPGDNFLRPRFGENKCWFYGEYIYYIIIYVICIGWIVLADIFQVLYFIDGCLFMVPFYSTVGE